MKTFWMVFISVFLAEIGDKTQIATLLFASEAKRGILEVFLGASFALVASSALAVMAGDALSHLINPRYIHIAAGVGFIIIGLVMLAKQ